VLPISLGVYAYSFYQRIQKGEDWVFLLCHDLIRAWSHVEILGNQLLDKYDTFIKGTNEYVTLFGGFDPSSPQARQPTAQLRIIEYIKDGQKVVTFEDCDFAIYSDIQPGRKCVYKKIVEKGATPFTDKFEPITDWHFLSLEIMASIHGVSKLFKIKLHTDDYNFYQVGNKLTPEFFRYYLQHLHNPVITEMDNDLHIDTLTIVDSNVTYTMDTFSAHERVEILLNKEDYTVVKSSM
jgi:hypothetical protein